MSREDPFTGVLGFPAAGVEREFGRRFSSLPLRYSEGDADAVGVVGAAFLAAACCALQAASWDG